jgi:hypothetical protein
VSETWIRKKIPHLLQWGKALRCGAGFCLESAAAAEDKQNNQDTAAVVVIIAAAGIEQADAVATATAAE